MCSCCCIKEFRLIGYSWMFQERKLILKIGIPRQSSSALTAKSTGDKNAHNSSNQTNKIQKYMKTIVRDLFVRERYNSADPCSGTYIYRLPKGMLLNIVLKYTHEKQAAKFG